MRKERIKIAVRPDVDPSGFIEVDAWQPGVPGLRITPARGPGGPNGLFAVTHKGTGMTIGLPTVKRKSQARRLAQAAGKLADWSAPEEELKALPGWVIDQLRSIPADVWEDWEPTPPDNVVHGISLDLTDQERRLLTTLAEEEGWSCPEEMVAQVHLDSIVPGICVRCTAVTDCCEPDARANWCHNCDGQTVKSALVLAGVV